MFEFSEAVDFALVDIDIVGTGTVGSFVTVADDTYTAVYSAPSGTATDTIDILADKYTDDFGNANTDTDTLDIAYDVTVPTVSLVADTSNTLKIGESTVITIRFSEDVDGFEFDDLEVTAGSITSDSFMKNSDKEYQVSFTPNPNQNNGSGVVTVPAGVAMGSENEVNLSGNITILYDTKIDAPTVLLDTDTGQSSDDRITQNGRVNVSNLESGASWQYKRAEDTLSLIHI